MTIDLAESGQKPETIFKILNYYFKPGSNSDSFLFVPLKKNTLHFLKTNTNLTYLK